MRFAGSRAAVLVLATLLAAAAHAAPAACPSFAAASSGLPTAGEWRTHPALGDIDGDGHLDIVGNPRKGNGPRAWFGDGAGRWTEHSTGLLIPELSCGVGVDLADIDGDGDLDLGVADHCQGVYIFRYSGDGVWQLTSQPSRHRLQGGFDAMRFGSIDGDDHLDVIATGAMTGGFGVIESDAKGNWNVLRTDLPRFGFAPEVKLRDIDGDGDLDVAAAFTSTEPGPNRSLPKHPAVWLNEGDGRFRPFAKGLPTEGDFRSVALGDLDGRGGLDLVISAGTWPGRAPLLVFLSPGPDGVWRSVDFGVEPQADASEVFEGVELADLNGDHVLDLVAVGHRDGGLHMWRGLGGSRFERCRETGLPLHREDVRGWGLSIGDVDGDRRPDIAYAYGRVAKGALEVWVQSRRAPALTRKAIPMSTLVEALSVRRP